MGSRIGNSSKAISFEDLSSNFHLPINDVAKKLGMCVTVLKQRCRENGISRWPYRKVRKLDKLISVLEVNSDQVVSQKLCMAKESLDFLRSNPNSRAHLKVGRVNINVMKSTTSLEDLNSEFKTKTESSIHSESLVQLDSACSSHIQQESMDTNIYIPVISSKSCRSLSVNSADILKFNSNLINVLNSNFESHPSMPSLQPIRPSPMLVQSPTSAFQRLETRKDSTRSGPNPYQCTEYSAPRCNPALFTETAPSSSYSCVSYPQSYYQNQRHQFNVTDEDLKSYHQAGMVWDPHADSRRYAEAQHYQNSMYMVPIQNSVNANNAWQEECRQQQAFWRPVHQQHMPTHQFNF